MAGVILKAQAVDDAVESALKAMGFVQGMNIHPNREQQLLQNMQNVARVAHVGKLGSTSLADDIVITWEELQLIIQHL